MVLQPVNTALWENYAPQVKLSDKKLMWRRNIGPRTLSSVDTHHLQLATSVIALQLKISTKSEARFAEKRLKSHNSLKILLLKMLKVEMSSTKSDHKEVTDLQTKCDVLEDFLLIIDTTFLRTQRL